MSTFISSIFGKKTTASAPIASPKQSGPSHSAASVIARTAIATPAPSTIMAPTPRIVAPAPKSPTRELVEALAAYKIIDMDPNKLEPMFVANEGSKYMKLNKVEGRVDLLDPIGGLVLIAQLIAHFKITEVNGAALDRRIGYLGDQAEFNSLLHGFAVDLMSQKIKFV